MCSITCAGTTLALFRYFFFLLPQILSLLHHFRHICQFRRWLMRMKKTTLIARRYFPFFPKWFWFQFHISVDPCVLLCACKPTDLRTRIGATQSIRNIRRSQLRVFDQHQTCTETTRNINTQYIHNNTYYVVATGGYSAHWLERKGGVWRFGVASIIGWQIGAHTKLQNRINCFFCVCVRKYNDAGMAKRYQIIGESDGREESNARVTLIGPILIHSVHCVQYTEYMF